MSARAATRPLSFPCGAARASSKHRSASVAVAARSRSSSRSSSAASARASSARARATRRGPPRRELREERVRLVRGEHARVPRRGVPRRRARSSSSVSRGRARARSRRAPRVVVSKSARPSAISACRAARARARAPVAPAGRARRAPTAPPRRPPRRAPSRQPRRGAARARRAAGERARGGRGRRDATVLEVELRRPGLEVGAQELELGHGSARAEPVAHVLGELGDVGLRQRRAVAHAPQVGRREHAIDRAAAAARRARRAVAAVRRARRRRRRRRVPPRAPRRRRAGSTSESACSRKWTASAGVPCTLSLSSSTVSRARSHRSRARAGVSAPSSSTSTTVSESGPRARGRGGRAVVLRRAEQGLEVLVRGLGPLRGARGLQRARHSPRSRAAHSGSWPFTAGRRRPNHRTTIMAETVEKLTDPGRLAWRAGHSGVARRAVPSCSKASPGISEATAATLEREQVSPPRCYRPQTRFVVTPGCGGGGRRRRSRSTSSS